jgi:hypothetical protein
MLLELITGRKPIMASDPQMDQSLVNWVNCLIHTFKQCNYQRNNFTMKNALTSLLVLQARPLLSRAITEDVYDELIDPWLQANYDQYDMTRLIHCAAAAVRHLAKKRPRMGQVN